MSNTAHQLERSEELLRRASARTPGGVHSNVRLTGPKVFIDHAKGAWLHSVEGDDYVTTCSAKGLTSWAMLLTWCLTLSSPLAVGGLIYGGQHELEVVASEAVCDALGWADMVRFGVSGTESVQAAMRLARAATGRIKIIRFEGHYHGWLDNVLLADRADGWGTASAGQLVSYLDDFIILPWNDADRVADVLEREGDQIAAVIMEPMMINAGVIAPRPGYLERVRELCTQYGAVLMFDEVISGFRLGLQGATGRFGVVPDLATYGKAMAGGWPVSALAGRAELMERFGTGEVNHSGTFNSSVMAMAAVAATVGFLRDESPYAAIEEHGSALMAGMSDLAESRNLPLRVAGLPMAFHVSFGDAEVTDYRSLQQLDLARYARLAELLVAHGIWVASRGIWYVSASHGPHELDVALARFDKALSEWSAT